jgi:cyanate lyase
MIWEVGIAEKIGMSPVWTHSAVMGMNAFPFKTSGFDGQHNGPATRSSATPDQDLGMQCRPIPASTVSMKSSVFMRPTLKALIQENL